MPAGVPRPLHARQPALVVAGGRQLGADVLAGVGEDLGADHRLDGVEQVVVAEEVEDPAAEVAGDVDAVGGAGVRPAERNQALVERQLGVVAVDLAFGEQPPRVAVDDLLEVGLHRGEVGVAEDSGHVHVPFAVKEIDLLLGQSGHGRCARSGLLVRWLDLWNGSVAGGPSAPTQHPGSGGDAPFTGGRGTEIRSRHRGGQMIRLPVCQLRTRSRILAARLFNGVRKSPGPGPAPESRRRNCASRRYGPLRRPGETN